MFIRRALACFITFLSLCGFHEGVGALNLGINIGSLGYGNFEQQFANLMYSAGNNDGQWDCNRACDATVVYDAQGYPKKLGTNPYYQLTYLFNFTFTGNYYVIAYDGDGVHPIANAGALTTGCHIGTGKVVDSTPGRIVVRQVSGKGVGEICITADDPLATGNYIRNMRVFDCKSNHTLGSCVDENTWNACKQINHMCLSAVWKAAFGTRHVGGPGFTSYRYMDAQNTYNNVPFSQRSVPLYYSYAAGAVEKTGIPLEVIAAVMNETCGSAHMNIPAGIIGEQTDGTFTGVITGSGSSGTLTVTGLTGTIPVGDWITWTNSFAQAGMTVSANLGGGTYTVIPAAGGSISARSSISMKASSITPSTAAYIQSVATVMQQNIVWCGGPSQKLRVEVGNETWAFTPYGYNFFDGLALPLFGLGGVIGGYQLKAIVQAQTGQIFKSTFGASIYKEHIESVVGVQPVTNAAAATNNGSMLTTPYWPGGPAYLNGIDAVTISNYYTLGSYGLPYGWLSLPDHGVANMTTELNGGAIVNNQILFNDQRFSQSGGSGYVNGTYPAVTVTSTHGSGAQCYFIVSRGSARCTAINAGSGVLAGDTLTVSNTSLGGSGSGWSAKVNTSPITNINQSGGSGYVCRSSYPCGYNWVPLTVTSGVGGPPLAQCYVGYVNAPLYCGVGSNAPNGSNGGGPNFAVNDGLSLPSNAGVGGSGSGWTATINTLSGPDTTVSQMLYETQLLQNWTSYLKTYGLPLEGYEAGDQILDQSGSDPMSTLICAWDTST